MGDTLRSADVLRDLVRIDSVNPRLVPGAAGEAAIAAHLAALLRGWGFSVWEDKIAPDRVNVTAVLPGTARERVSGLVLCGHTDTVGIVNMTIPPFSGDVEGDRLYGRGALDMKAGLAAILAAAHAITASGPLAGDLILGFVADEEYASIGVEQFVARLPERGLSAAAGIVTEPTNLAVVHAHKGFAWGRIETRGHAAHGSDYTSGVDAIAHMGRVLVRLEQFDRETLTQRVHPLCGRASLHASLITGGTELSTYPDRCTLEIERRLLPGETAAQAEHEISAILAGLAGESPDFAATYTQFFARLPLEVDAHAPIIRALDAAAAPILGPGLPRHEGMGGWTDAQVLDAAGIPTVLFGPGATLDASGPGLSLAHAAVEYASIASTETCARVLEAVARSLLQEGRENRSL